MESLCVLALLGLLGGCHAFQNKAAYSIAEEQLADGSRVVLWEEIVVWPFSQSRTFSLSRDRRVRQPGPEGDRIGRESGDERFLLRTHPTDLKAWVVDQRTGDVVLSMDYETDQAWCGPEEQPEWATRGERQ